MQTCMVTKKMREDERSFRDSVEEPLGISDGDTGAEEKEKETLAANQEECSSEGGRPPSALLLLLVLFVCFPQTSSAVGTL